MSSVEPLNQRLILLLTLDHQETAIAPQGGHLAKPVRKTKPSANIVYEVLRENAESKYKIMSAC